MINETTITYRAASPSEYDLLKMFLYEAIYIPDGVTPPERSIIEHPKLALYYEDFGDGKADYCFAAEKDGRIVGMAWTRIMDDYGHIDDDTPSLAMSVLKMHRGQGIGTHLLQALTDLLLDKGYKSVSLSVQKENPAVRLYERMDFNTVMENEQEYIMLRYNE